MGRSLRQTYYVGWDAKYSAKYAASMMREGGKYAASMV
jgi:hypothetical protein